MRTLFLTAVLGIGSMALLLGAAPQPAQANPFRSFSGYRSFSVAPGYYSSGYYAPTYSYYSAPGYYTPYYGGYYGSYYYTPAPAYTYYYSPPVYTVPRYYYAPYYSPGVSYYYGY